MTMETLVRVAVGTGLSMLWAIASIVSVFSGCRLGSSRRMAGKGSLTSETSGIAGPTTVSVCDIVYTSRLPTVLSYQQWEADGQVNFEEEIRRRPCWRQVSLA